MRRLALVALLPLAACSTPRAQCDRAAVEDLNVVSALIVETEQALARGYTIRRDVEEVPNIQFCFGNSIDDDVGVVFCNDSETRITETPVAIDVEAEQRKLADLKRKQAELVESSAAALRRCAGLYPEG